MSHKDYPFIVLPMEISHAKSICEWKFAPPYNIYGWLPWEQMELLGIEFGDPLLRATQYLSVMNESGDLCGFAQLFPLEGVTRLGICMHPDLCGQGKGKSFVLSIVHAALLREPHDEIDLEVLTWNKRAIQAYIKANFIITDCYERLTPEGIKDFYCMVYQLNND
ncbi:RimJ/RimL family protein N-acetyltransferase [Paenibacillus sp. DS2015]|uniref:GNAT family N-acetyltransferase n=1 Tax=Paenibacillus sp. DS2015 TaxID=3373917 RepID=UPI003D1B8AF6